MADEPTTDPHAPAADARWGGTAVLLALVVAVAAVLRLVGIRHGLSNPGAADESLAGRAWRMSHGGGLDPHAFRTPSGLLDLLAAVEAPFAHPSILAARIAVVVLALGAVAATWWAGAVYGQIAGGVAAAIVAVETLHVAAAHTVSPAVVATLPVAGALGFLARDRLVLAGLAAGVAAAVDYRAVLLLVPLVGAGWGRWRPFTLAVVGGVVAFAALSPFALLHPGVALGDLADSVRGGTAAAGVGAVAQLWDGFGPVLVVALLGFSLATAQRRGTADLALAAFAGAGLLILVALGSPTASATLVLVPALAILAARVRYLAAVTVILLAVPLTWAIRADARLVRQEPAVKAAVRLFPHGAPAPDLGPRGLRLERRRPYGAGGRHPPHGLQEVHVNFRGYPGRTAIPLCERDTGAKTQRVPCFSHVVRSLVPIDPA